VFFSIVAIVKIVSEATTRRRLLERAATDADISKAFLAHPELVNLSSLKWGMVLVGIGLAWLISRWLPYSYYVRDETVFGLMFLLAGIGLLVYYPIAQNKLKKIQQDQAKQPPAPRA
jgi:hypothetical protein